MKHKILYCAAVLVMIFTSFGCKKELAPNDAGALAPKTVDEDPSLPSITVNGTRLHSEAFGNPNHPMVVFLHGGPGSDYRNALNVKNLVSNNYYVVFYDQRGSGLSKRHPKSSYNVQVMLDDLSAVIQHYRSSPSQKIFLFGHSWGAMLATAYINKYPTAINGVVLAEPGGFTWSGVKEYSKRSRKLKIFDEATNDAIFPDQFLNGRENQHAILDYKIAVSYSYTYSRNNEEGIEGPSPFWRNGAAVLSGLFELGEKDGFDFSTDLVKYNTKVLFLYSENNRAYGEAYAQRLSSSFRNVQLSRVNGTGHEMIYFAWDKVYALALPYLESLR
jgi:proline iminopeptidase